MEVLFSEPIKTPVFNDELYLYLCEACNFEWNKINPSIFGSLFQYVMDENMRGDLGSHYTSEENILKVINPLFMDNLREEYNQALKKSSKKDKKYYLEKLLEKMGNLKFFDPACGSGNFLIVTYRELRLLEYKILEKIRSLESNIKKWKDKQTILIPGSITKIKIENFYGIEIDEFSSKIAQVSMWFIEHQMNLKYESLDLHEDNLPLKQYVNIKNENSLRMDWKEVVQPDNNVYIIGNPPFGGKQNQNKEQKDMKLVFKGFKNIGTLDYVTAWYKKALDYMKGTKIESAFVSTNSICQGEQVPNLWI
nr:DNA methyltransferase [Methanosphaera cuniculi]